MKKDNICPVFPKKFASVFVEFLQKNELETKTTVPYSKWRCTTICSSICFAKSKDFAKTWTTFPKTKFRVTIYGKTTVHCSV
jgi:hypothetical protein